MHALGKKMIPILFVKCCDPKRVPALLLSFDFVRVNDDLS